MTLSRIRSYLDYAIIYVEYGDLSWIMPKSAYTYQSYKIQNTDTEWMIE